MDAERAKQIMRSREKIEVLYQGSPVWIESLRNNNIAEVTFLGSNIRADVPADLLTEGRKRF